MPAPAAALPIKWAAQPPLAPPGYEYRRTATPSRRDHNGVEVFRWEPRRVSTVTTTQAQEPRQRDSLR